MRRGDTPLSCPIERVGIIGAGAAARLHLRALRRIEGVRVVGIRDLDARRAAGLAAEFGLQPEVADPAGFYASGPQSIHVVTTPDSHEELAIEALRHGAHVLIEKPPALTVSGCGRLLAEAAARGLSIGVNENTACDPLIRRARAIIETGRLGRVLHIDGYYSFGLREGETPAPWMNPLPGGMLEDLLPHLLTTARALAGQRLVAEHWWLAATGGLPGQRHDELRLLLSGDGLTANLTLSLSARPRAFTLVIRGTRATVAIDLRNMLLHLSPAELSGGAVAIGRELGRSALGVLWQTASNAAGVIAGYREPHGSFLHLIRAHYVALQTKTTLPAPLARATETIEIIRKIWPVTGETVQNSASRIAAHPRTEVPMSA